MKKLSLALMITSMAAPLAHADTILGVYAGAGSWNAAYSGDFGAPVSTSLKDLGVKDEKQNYFYIALEHPIPLVPNIRLEKMDVTSTQSANITKSFTFDKVVYNASEKVNSEFDLSHLDATLYYEILDNWVNLDIGVTARMFNGYAEATTSTNPIKTKKVDLDETLPMLYVKAQFDLPFSGLSVAAEGNAVSYSGSKLTDLQAKIAYMFDGVFDIGVEGGYRSMSLTVDEDDINTTFDMKGPYVALIAHF